MQLSENKPNELKPHAIIVEDEQALATAYKIALTQAGYYVEHFTNGKKALKHLKNVAPRLLLLDLNLPEVSGDEILEAIKQLRGYKDTYIFLITANYRLAEELSASADIVLQKPIGIRVLRKIAERYKPAKEKNEAPTESVDVDTYTHIFSRYGF